MPKPIFTHSALRDLDAVRRWLTQIGAGDRAAKKRRDIASAIREIGDAPHRWPDSRDHPGVKERHVHGYTIHYACDDAIGEVKILRVFGPGQGRTAE